MPCIKVVEENEARGRLKEVYREIKRERGKVANILKVHSLNPDAMKNHLDLYVLLVCLLVNRRMRLKPDQV